MAFTAFMNILPLIEGDMIDYHTQEQNITRVFGKLRFQHVVLSLLCVQYQPLLRKVEFTKIIEK